MTFPEGAQVPTVTGEARPGGDGWERPLLDLQDAGHPLLGTWALVVALALGTMGLPHVIMRFHTSPDGRAARRTAAFTVALLSVFYLFPGIYGVLGRVLVPQLYLSGATDIAVVALPAQVDSGWPGDAVHRAADRRRVRRVPRHLARPASSSSPARSPTTCSPGGLGRLRFTVVAVAAVVVLLALQAIRLDAGVLVTWAFTVAASTFCPLLVLGIWWSAAHRRRRDERRARRPVRVQRRDRRHALGPAGHGWLAILVAQPAPWSVPLAFATMIVVSLPRTAADLGTRPPCCACTSTRTAPRLRPTACGPFATRT